MRWKNLELAHGPDCGRVEKSSKKKVMTGLTEPEWL
jgi:hypothetical protein